MKPGRFVVVDQFIDRTVARPASFFGKGMVAHVSMAEPVCARLSGFAADAVADFSREKHDMALRYVADVCGVPMTTTQILEVL